MCYKPSRHDNHGVKRAPIKLDYSDSSTPKLPDSYVIQDPVELIDTNVFVPRGFHSKVRPAPNVQIAKVKDESWMAHSSRILQPDQMEESDIINIITWSGYNSMLATEDTVKPPAEIGIYQLFQANTASASSMKHAMELAMKSIVFLNSC